MRESTIKFETMDFAGVPIHAGATIDFPTAWAIQREVGATLKHDPRCSSVPGWNAISGPGLLCDCGAVEAEWERRQASDSEWVTCISLWRPWADWCALGWKTIETRLHNRLRKLAGRRIGIHASKTWDPKAVDAARPYLDDAQAFASPLMKLDTGRNGHVLCTAMVSSSRPLIVGDSAEALIDCRHTQRFGLFLTDVRTLPVCPETFATGRQGPFGVKLPTRLLAAPSPAKREGDHA